MLGLLMTVSITQAEGDRAARLDEICKAAAASAIAHFEEEIDPTHIAIALAEIDPKSQTWQRGEYRGDFAMYPASVVKMFFAVRAMRLLDEGEIERDPEFDRALHDMIVDSSNDATGLIVDVITGTTGGPSLPPDKLDEFMHRRQSVNRWYASLGYSDVQASQKTWNEGPYGRERQGYGQDWSLRNSLTPNACLRLVAELALGRLVSEERRAELLDLMRRPTPANSKERDGQVQGFAGIVTPQGWTHYSKSGNAYEVRHDLAYLVGPDGRQVAFCIFTDHHGGNRELLGYIAGELLRGLGIPPHQPSAEGNAD